MDKPKCSYCGERTVARRGLCYSCYKDTDIREAALFRGREAKLPPDIACPNCKKRKSVKGKRGLCIECWKSPLIREQFPNRKCRVNEPRLTTEQAAAIAEHKTVIEKYVLGMCRKWGVLQTDREELLSAAFEVVCRRGTRLKFDGNCNVRSFLIRAAIYGMRWGLRWGPFKRPNTVYLAHDDTDGKAVYRRIVDIGD